MSYKKKIYFDYAASTPVDPRVFEAMKPYFLNYFGNPGSLHSFGQAAIGAVDAAREEIGKEIGAGFREIIFTGSATEANNLALRGAIKKFRARHKAVTPKIIISSIEHESVIATAEDLKNEGVEVVYLSVDKNGIIDQESLRVSLDDRTTIISIMYANNEIGTLQPIAELAEVVKKFRADKENSQFPMFHTDAVQAFQFLRCDVDDLGVDLMTLSAHKIYGPKGIGFLYVRNPLSEALRIHTILTGGGQEFGVRSGTENVPLIVGFAHAVRLAARAREKEKNRISELRDRFLDDIKKIFPTAELNGIKDVRRLPNILNIYFPGYSAQDLLIKFDLAGLAVSSGSACQSRASKSSYVIRALGYSEERAKSSIRFSFGKETTKKEAAAALAIIKKTFVHPAA